jgi:hypothetical protein
VYDTYYTKDNLDGVIKFLADKIKDTNSPTLKTVSYLDKGKGKAF